MKNKENKSKIIAIMSSDLAGGVKKFSSYIREFGIKSLLITNVKDDPNAFSCDFSLYFSWQEGNLNQLVKEIKNQSHNVLYIINACERLIQWQIQLLELLGIPDPNSNAYHFLKSKYSVRKKLHEEGISDIKFIGGSLRNLLSTPWDDFPCILKPSYYSGASRWVRTCNNITGLRNTIEKLLNNSFLVHEEFIIEEYVSGIEFSYDGYVENQKFNELFLAEKLNFDYENNHDGDSIIFPVVNVSKKATYNLEKLIHTIVNVLQIKSMFLHIEGRITEESVTIIEINARMGGGEYPHAVKYATGIEPFKAMFDLIISGTVLRNEEHSSPKKYTMMVKFNVKQYGIFKTQTSLNEILSLPNVISGYISDGYKITALERENVMAAFTICGDTYEDVIHLREKIKQSFKFVVVEN